MKKIVLLTAVLMLSSLSTYALEPLIIVPLGQESNVDAPEIEETGYTTATTDANFVPASRVQYDPNMVPQNNAAKGLPTERRKPRIFIETKQGTQTNTQWNPGGKGTKSFF